MFVSFVLMLYVGCRLGRRLCWGPLHLLDGGDQLLHGAEEDLVLVPREPALEGRQFAKQGVDGPFRLVGRLLSLWLL